MVEEEESNIVYSTESTISGMYMCSHGHYHRGSHVKFARILLVYE